MAATRNWEPFDPFDGADLPVGPGVYVIYIDGAVAYIGSSSNLKARLGQHRIRRDHAQNIKTPWGKLRWHRQVVGKYRRSQRLGDWLMRELRLIYRLHPKFNIRGRRGAQEGGQCQAA